jgi:pyridoxine 5-phosphate synthase
LREDRRHINDSDVKALRMKINTRLNLEMSIAREIVDIACKIGPDQATLVPERRQEITTEGGLDVVKYEKAIRGAVGRLQDRGIEVSLFINPARAQVEASYRTGARIVEFHTGEYANASTKTASKHEFGTLKRAAEYAIGLGIQVNAGHGLDYVNTKAVAKIKGMHELNIGHSIVSRAVFVGLSKAVKEMLELVR